MSVPAQTRMTPPDATRIDFGWIKQAWALFSAQPGVWVGAIFLCFLINVALWILLAIPNGELAALQAAFHQGLAAGAAHTQRLPPPSALHFLEYAEQQVASILLAGIGIVLIGGLYRMALQQKRGELISVNDLFSALPQSVPLFLVGSAAPAVRGLMDTVSWWLLHHLRASLSSASAVNQAETGLHVLLDGLLMFAPLLVVDAGASAPEAIFGSIRLLGRQWLRGIGFYIVASFVGGSGLLLCGVGMLATYPIFLISITIAYLALTQFDAAASPMPFDPAPVGVWPRRPAFQRRNDDERSRAPQYQ
jgi:hypothetical protein